jgi:ubiquinone/menaquinone biosynthesis C-methylase UbiE
MNWHQRYSQQASWTRDLRNYLFEKAGLQNAQRVLEVGCGTGAILADLSTPASLHGLDLNSAALTECRVHAPGVCLTQGDALALPFSDECFEIAYCHFLLLWVSNPLQAVSELKRVTRRGGSILALAEPDYTDRIDKPDELAQLGRWQTESLKRQGADPSFGRHLAETFYQVGIKLIETGPIQSAALSHPQAEVSIDGASAAGQVQVSAVEPRSKGQEMIRSAEQWKQEWDVIEADLAGFIPDEEIQKMKSLDEEAWERGNRILHVPTYFAWGKT